MQFADANVFDEILKNASVAVQTAPRLVFDVVIKFSPEINVESCNIPALRAALEANGLQMTEIRERTIVVECSIEFQAVQEILMKMRQGWSRHQISMQADKMRVVELLRNRGYRTQVGVNDHSVGIWSKEEV